MINLLNMSGNILMQMFLLFFILGVFYMLYISKVETKAISKELEKNISPMIEKNVDELLTNPIIKSQVKLNKKFINAKLNNLKLLYSKPSDFVKNNNKWMFDFIKISIIFFLIILVLYLSLIKQLDNNISIFEIVTENTIIFIFIGMIEFMFFKYVAIKYVAVLPSKLETLLVSNLKNI